VVVPRAARRILAISRTVEGLGAAPRESLERFHLASESSSNWVNLWLNGRFSTRGI
jgi:hypothetical protein